MLWAISDWKLGEISNEPRSCHASETTENLYSVLLTFWFLWHSRQGSHWEAGSDPWWTSSSALASACTVTLHYLRIEKERHLWRHKDDCQFWCKERESRELLPITKGTSTGFVVCPLQGEEFPGSCDALWLSLHLNTHVEDGTPQITSMPLFYLVVQSC